MLLFLGAVVLALHAPRMAAVVDGGSDSTTHGEPRAARRGVNVADSLVVEKSAHRLTLYRHGAILRSYQVALGFHPTGPKTQVGDGRTPEGVYRIDYRNPESRYYRSLHISYPNAVDRAVAAHRGVSPGGEVMIHGLPPRFAYYGHDHLKWDWTNGCVAVTDQEMDEIWSSVPVGTPIEIKP